MLDWPLLTRAASTTPANPAGRRRWCKPSPVLIDVDAGDPRRGHVAADGVDVFAVAGVLECDMEDHRNHREDDHRHRARPIDVKPSDRKLTGLPLV